MIGSGMNLVMTVIGFTVSIMFIVFVCTRLICARIQLHTSRRSFPITSRSDLSTLERGLHGLEPVLVANFPTKKYSDDLFLASEDAQCTVCLAEYRIGDELRILPYCGHSFHLTCIDMWLHQHSTCPVCRISLRELPEKKHMMPMFSSAIRSPFCMESFGTHSQGCCLTVGELASRAGDSHMLDTIQESHCTPEGHGRGSGEHLSPLTESNRNRKDPENKHVESPSNP